MSNKPEVPPTPRISKEVAALDAHLALINSIPQPGAPDGIQPPPASATPPPASATPPAPEFLPPNPETLPFTPESLASAFITDDTPPVAAAPRVGQKLFFTGRLKSGKDYVAKASGAVIFGFADPLYDVATYYLGTIVSATEGKDIPGVRAFLQTIGQWGRGVVNEAYPLSPTRALFLQQLRRDVADGVFSSKGAVYVTTAAEQVDWAGFGKDPDIWLNAAIVRAKAFLAANPDKRIAITNCRFGNEFSRLQAEGFDHYHCMCGPKTWAARLAESKLTPESPSVRDMSEQLAGKLDQSVIKQLSAQKVGPMLKAIWNDPLAPKPSTRLHSVESFLQTIGGAQ